MVGLSAGMHSGEMTALSTPEPVLTSSRAKTTLWVSLISTPCAAKFGCWSACAVFGLVVDHTVPSWRLCLFHYTSFHSPAHLLES